MCGGEERCIQDFCRKPEAKRPHGKLGHKGKNTIKMRWEPCTGLIRLRIWTSGRLL